MHDNQRSDRRSRSGSRQRSHRGGRRETSRSSGPYSTYSKPQLPEKKPSFWQKLVGFFTRKSKSASSSRPSSAHSSRQDRQPSQNGHRRFESAPASSSTPRQSRKPEVVEVNSPKLYVGNLSFDATETDLEELFNGVGQVQSAEVVSNKYTQKSKGFAFVSMLTVDEARRAVTELHDKEFMGRKLVVSGAKTNDASTRSVEAHSESAPVEPSTL
jgi:RNA recognition motif-containing protein